MNIFERVAEYRAENNRLAWSGTFREYIEILKKDPTPAMTAHARVYKMIESFGVEEVGGHKRYKFLSRRSLDWIERWKSWWRNISIHQPGGSMYASVSFFDGSRQWGKSTLVTLLKRGLEKFSRTDQGAVYAIEGCPMHEDPLHLIPHELRPDFEKELGVRIEGNLCPSCQMRLRTEFDGDIEKVRVERVFISEENRIGIGTFSPSDPKSQDIADLTGSIDFSTITEYGSESDPRAYRFDGELNKANRGLMEFQEMLKCDEKFLWNLLSLTQEGNFKAGRFALISADELIVAHTNESEYKSFIANKKNEALQSRMIVMPIPYNLKVSEEEKIYAKLIEQSDMKHIHIAPHALRTAAIFSVLTRLKETKKQGMDLVKKMRMYDGEEVEGYKEADLKEMQSEFLEEGMSGVDPRYVINRISSALIKQNVESINALDILRAIKDGLDQHASITKEERERYLNFISVARKEYDELAKKEVQKAFVYSFEESAKTLFDNYLDNIEAFCNWAKIRDPLTDEELDPDERLMRSIEEQIGVSENAKKAFREEILIRISAYSRKGRKFEYHHHDRLREAIEKKLFADLKDIVKITTSTKTPDANQLKRMNEVIKRLIEEHGYTGASANDLLRYVGSLLNR